MKQQKLVRNAIKQIIFSLSFFSTLLVQAIEYDEKVLLDFQEKSDLFSFSSVKPVGFSKDGTKIYFLKSMQLEPKGAFVHTLNAYDLLSSISTEILSDSTDDIAISSDGSYAAYVTSIKNPTLVKVFNLETYETEVSFDVSGGIAEKKEEVIGGRIIWRPNTHRLAFVTKSSEDVYVASYGTTLPKYHHINLIAKTKKGWKITYGVYKTQNQVRDLNYSFDGLKLMFHEYVLDSYCTNTDKTPNKVQILQANSFTLLKSIKMQCNGSAANPAGDDPKISPDGKTLYFQWREIIDSTFWGYKLGKVDLHTLVVDQDYGEKVFGELKMGENTNNLLLQYEIDPTNGDLYIVRERGSHSPLDEQVINGKLSDLSSDVIKIPSNAPFSYEVIVPSKFEGGADYNSSLALSSASPVAAKGAPAIALVKNYSPDTEQLVLLGDFCNISKGDVNLDNQTDILDVQKVTTMVLGTLGFSVEEFCKADVNCDGQINVVDLILIIRKSLKLNYGVSVDANQNGYVDACEA